MLERRGFRVDGRKVGGGYDNKATVHASTAACCLLLWMDCVVISSV